MMTQPVDQLGSAFTELDKHVELLLREHEQLRGDQPRTGPQYKKVSMIDRFFSGLVQRLLQYEGTRDLIYEAAAKGGPPREGAHESSRLKPPPAKLTIFDRNVAWGKARQARLAEVRQKKLQAEALPPAPRRKSTQYDHVQSVMRVQRLEEEQAKREADLEAERLAAEEARLRAELAYRAAAEEKLVAQAQRDDAAIDKEVRRRKAEAARLRAEAARRAREERVALEREEEQKRRLVRAAFGSKGLEQRASMPDKMVWRVSSPSRLTGNVAHEYRVKDKLTNTKGVSFVMGQLRDSADDVVQCVLFDKEAFDEHAAAQWWTQHEHRFSAPRLKSAAAMAAAAAKHQGKPAAAGAALAAVEEEAS